MYFSYNTETVRDATPQPITVNKNKGSDAVSTLKLPSNLCTVCPGSDNKKDVHTTSHANDRTDVHEEANVNSENGEFPTSEHTRRPKSEAGTDLEDNHDPTFLPPSTFDRPRSTIHRYLFTNISSESKLTSNLLLGLGLATGINDAATFIDYHLFVSNQTGNTVFLGIGALDMDTIFDLRHVGVSLGLFLAGGLFSGQIATYVAGKRARWWIILSNLMQTSFMFAAAALRYWYATVDSMGPNHGTPRSYSVVAFLAFASGMQVAMARGLGVAEIPTGMITSALLDLMIDEKVWWVWRRNASRDRRLGFVLCILVGGFIGAAASVYCDRALPLLLAAIVKTLVTVGFAFGRGEGLTDEKDDAPKKKRREVKESARAYQETKENDR